MKNFLLLYWTSKLYKNPTKAKFVIAAPKCSVKAPSKAVEAKLQPNGTLIKYYSGFKTFWPSQKSQTVINVIIKINSNNKTISISTCDFCTLYKSISHRKLKSLMVELISF